MPAWDLKKSDWDAKTPAWDPERLLDIRGRPRFSGGIQCNGRSQWGSRCGWTKGGRSDESADVRHAEDLIDSLARQAPSKVTTTDLKKLAKLCLCRDNHDWNQDQIDKVLSRWEGKMAEVVSAQKPAANSSATNGTVNKPDPGVIERSTLAGDLAAAQQKLSALQIENRALSEKEERAKLQVSESLAGAEHMKTSLKAANEGLATTEQQLKLAKDEMETVERRLAAATEEKDAAKDVLAATQSELAGLRKKNRFLKGEQQRLEKLVSTHRRDKEHAEEKMTALEAELGEKEEKMEVFNNELKTTKDILKAMKDVWSATKEEMANDMKSLRAKEEAKLRRKDDLLTAAEERLKVVQDGLGRTKAELSAKMEELKFSDERLAAEQETGEKMRKELAAVERKLQNAETEAVTVQGKLRDVERRLSQALAENRMAIEIKDCELQVSRNQYNALRDDGRRLARFIGQKDNELREAREENARLRIKLDEAEARAMQQQAALLMARSDIPRPRKTLRSWFRQLSGSLKMVRNEA